MLVDTASLPRPAADREPLQLQHRRPNFSARQRRFSTESMPVSPLQVLHSPIGELPAPVEPSHRSVISSASSVASSSSSLSSGSSLWTIYSEDTQGLSSKRSIVVGKLLSILLANSDGINDSESDDNSTNNNAIGLECALGALCNLVGNRRWKHLREHLQQSRVVNALAHVVAQGPCLTTRRHAVTLLWAVSGWLPRKADQRLFVATLVSCHMVGALVRLWDDVVAQAAATETASATAVVSNSAAEALGLLRLIVSHYPASHTVSVDVVARQLAHVVRSGVDRATAPTAECLERAAGLAWMLNLKCAAMDPVLLSCIPELVALLTSGSRAAQECAAGAIWSMSSNRGIQELLRHHGAVPALLEVVAHGSSLGRDHAAGALLHLGHQDVNVRSCA